MAAPLRRRPKQLTARPSLYLPSASGTGLALSSGDRRRGRGPTSSRGSRSGTSDEAELVALADLEGRTDDGARRRARQIARRLAVPRPHGVERIRATDGELRTVRWRGGADALDLDATLDVVAGNPVPADEDVLVRERRRTARSVVLAVDVSGSMTGERALTAAATVGALSSRLLDDRIAVVAFWSDAAVLVGPDERREPLAVLDLLLRIPSRGLTNVSFALETAAGLVAGDATHARVLLLSDCVHNAGPDPRGIGARLPRLDVLLDVTGEKDVELGRDLARVGRGRCRLVRGHRDVPAALGAIFES